MIEERIDNQPQGYEEQKPKSEPSLIEIDGSVESANTPAANVNEQVADAPHKPLTAEEKKQKLKEMKAKKEAEYKAKQKAEKLRLKEQKKAEASAANQDGNKKSNKLVIAVIAVFILIGGGFAYIYFMKPELLKKVLPGKNKEAIELANTDSSKSASNENVQSEGSSEATDSSATIAQPAQSVPEPEPVSTPAPVAKSKKESTYTSPESNSGKGQKISGPCWIVSYSSVSDEKIASKGVKKLVDNGFLAGYYWMPDVDAAAKQLFKVYSGPYTSEAEARVKQREIAVFNPDAYVMKLDKQ